MMRIIDAMDRADRHEVLRVGVVPLVYLLGALGVLAVAYTIPPAGRTELFSVLFFVVAAVAPLFATAGTRAHAQVGWMIAWLGLVGMSALAYSVIGLEVAVFR